MDSVVIIRRLCSTWMAIGFDWPEKYKTYARVYRVIATILAVIWFPLHLIINLANSKSQAEIFQNLVMNVAATSNSIKHGFLRYKRPAMITLNVGFEKLDNRVQHPEEQKYRRESIVNVSRRMLNMFAVSYFAVPLSSVVGLVLGGKRILPYPGWMPFDWNSTIYHYVGAVSLQYVALFLATLINLFNDSYGPILLCTFAGHVHMLQMRIQRIGFDSHIPEHIHAQELKRCIRDYQQLMSTYKFIKETLSWEIFTQIIASSINICGAVIYIVLYAKNIYDIAYFSIHLIAIVVELLPVCYYGSLLQLKFQELTYSIYSCNWLEQSHSFRTNMIILTDLTMRDVTPYAGNMFRIHLDSYFATCKMAYSLVTLIMSMK